MKNFSKVLTFALLSIFFVDAYAQPPHVREKKRRKEALKKERKYQQKMWKAEAEDYREERKGRKDEMKQRRKRPNPSQGYPPYDNGAYEEDNRRNRERDGRYSRNQGREREYPRGKEDKRDYEIERERERATKESRENQPRSRSRKQAEERIFRGEQTASSARVKIQEARSRLENRWRKGGISRKEYDDRKSRIDRASEKLEMYDRKLKQGRSRIIN